MIIEQRIYIFNIRGKKENSLGNLTLFFFFFLLYKENRLKIFFEMIGNFVWRGKIFC